MYYVYFWDSDLFQWLINSFTKEDDALGFITTLVNSGESLDNVMLVKGTNVKLKTIEVTTKVVRA